MRSGLFIRVRKEGELASNIDSEIHIFGDEYERRELGELAESIKDFLRDNPGTIKSQVAKTIGANRNKIYRAVNMLLIQGVLEIGPGEGRGDHLYLKV